MNKTIVLAIILAFFISGCFSMPSFKSLNPFSKNIPVGKQEIKIPDEAPKWLVEQKIKNNISSIGVSDIKKQLNKKEYIFHRKKALISASQNLTKTIYSKSIYIFKNYIKKIENPNIFDKDVKRYAEHISLKSLTHSKITNTWLSPENKLFVQIAVDSNIIAEQIQSASKLLFNVDKNLYKNFLSNRAKKDIIKEFEIDAN